MISSHKDTIVFLCLFLLSLFVFSRSLSVHGLEYRDDEIFYFQSTQEMLANGNILSPTYFGEDRFQKPILYYWLVLCSYKLFGVSWFSARFIALIFAGLTVGVTWLMGKNFFGRSSASLSALVLMTVPLFFRHAKNAVPDMPLNFFIVWAEYCALRFMRLSSVKEGPPGHHARTQKWGLLFFLSCALGFMIKGFAALIFPLLTVLVYSFWAGNPKILLKMRFGRGMAVMLVIIAPWFLYMIKTHGPGYLDYMLVDETKNRLVNVGSGFLPLKLLTTFFDHCLFYLNVIGSYFAPWSVFFLVAFPWAFAQVFQKAGRENKEGLRFLLSWFCVVFAFFSVMYFSINHYMLVLTTPFALLTGRFFSAEINNQILVGKMAVFLRKYLALFILTAGYLAFAFLLVFLAGGAKGWLLVLLFAYLIMAVWVFRSRKPRTAPFMLGLFLLFVFSQSALMGKAGITSHSALQKFAGTLRKDLGSGLSDKVVIGVGSHDIHEKEFQVYFDRKVVKAAGSEEEETRSKLRRLFAREGRIYCLMTEKDYDRYLKGQAAGPFKIIQEDDIFRRRMHIDKGFFTALLKLDQATVRRYLKEKIILIRKDPHA